MKIYLTLFTWTALLALVGAKEFPTFDDPLGLKKILAEATPREALQERKQDGDTSEFVGEDQMPFTGWTKAVDERGQPYSLVHLEEGKITGPSFTWHENGQKAQLANYRDGQLEGHFTKWHDNGQKSAESNFKKGQLDGRVVKWHKNGKKEADIDFKDGKMDGLFRTYHENGQMSAEATCKDGLIVGNAIRWDKDGTELSRARLNDGRLDVEADLGNPKVIAKLAAQAIEWSNLQKDQLGRYHLPTQDEPYTGWIKKTHDNGRVALLGVLTLGEPTGKWAWFDENGIKTEEKQH